MMLAHSADETPPSLFDHDEIRRALQVLTLPV